MKGKDLLKYALSVAAALVLLYFSFRSMDWGAFVTCLKACRWEYVLVTMLCCTGVQWVRALRYRMLLRPMDASLPFRAAISSVNIGMLANLVLPRAGELVRCGYVTRHSRRGADGRRLASVDKVLGTVVVERGWDVVFGLGMLVVLFMVLWGRFGAYVRGNLLGPLREKAAAIWLLPVLLVLVGLALWLLYRFRERSRICRKLFELFQGLGIGLSACLHMKRGWLFVLYTFVVWLLYWGQSWFVLLAMQGIAPGALDGAFAEGLALLQGLGPVDALFLTLAGAASTLIPVPGGFGAFHGVVAGALSSVYGVPFGLGLLFATLTHEAVTLTQILLGLGSFAYESVKKPIA